MTSVDLFHPTEGAKLDIDLLYLTLKYCAYIALGQHRYMCVQLANRGGDVPTLCVEPDDKLSRRKPLVRVRYQNAYEGFDIPGRAQTLPGYLSRHLLDRN